MRAVVQRVKKSSVTVDEKITGEIGKGLMVLIGVEGGDTEKDADYIADKICGLRIFEDELGKMNLDHITAYAEELKQAGVEQEGVSPLLLPKYARHER